MIPVSVGLLVALAPVEGRDVDAEELGGARLVAAALGHDEGDVVGLELAQRNDLLASLRQRTEVEALRRCQPVEVGHVDDRAVGHQDQPGGQVL